MIGKPAQRVCRNYPIQRAFISIQNTSKALEAWLLFYGDRSQVSSRAIRGHTLPSKEGWWVASGLHLHDCVCRIPPSSTTMAMMLCVHYEFLRQLGLRLSSGAPSNNPLHTKYALLPTFARSGTEPYCRATGCRRHHRSP